MSLLWNWFWSSKKLKPEECEKAASAHRALFEELHSYFKNHGTTKLAERKFDFDEVYQTLSEDMLAIDEYYEVLDFVDDKFVFPNDTVRKELRDAIELYLDHVVQFREFVWENSILRDRLAHNLLNYPLYEGFYFAGHYWQLFRRDLRMDLKNPEQALAEIMEPPTAADTEFSEDESSSEEFQK